jgi:hypothetical protein
MIETVSVCDSVWRKVFCMRKRFLGVLCLTVGACVCVQAADWPSTAGNPQRDGWAQGETYLSKEAVTNKKVQLLYKYKFDNEAKGLNAMSAPIDLSALIGYKGFKELLFIGGSSDTLYSIDSDLGEPYFKTKFDLKEKAASASSSVLCPGGMTASVAMPGISAPRRFGMGGARGGPAVVFAVSSDGYLRLVRQQDGDDKYIAATKFVPANARVTGLNVDNNVIYAATVNGCGGNPNGLYASNFTPPQLPPMPGEPLLSQPAFEVTSFLTNGSGFSGSGGTAIGTSGTIVYGQVAEGHGDVAGTYSDTVLALDAKTLAVKDYFTPSGTLPALKKDSESAGVTPAVFQWNSKDVVVAGGRDGRLYLLDSASLGGSDHHTPLASTEPIVAPDAQFAGNGIWGSFSTWVDAANKNTRWIYAAVRGPVSAKFAGTNGPAAAGAIVAFKVEDEGGKPKLTPEWVSGDMISPAAPVTANGLVFALSTGLAPRVAKKDGSPYTVAEVEKMSRNAVLHILDGATGKELYTSGNAATSFAQSGLAVANGRVYFTTHDNTVFAYGVPIER